MLQSRSITDNAPFVGGLHGPTLGFFQTLKAVAAAVSFIDNLSDNHHEHKSIFCSSWYRWCRVRREGNTWRYAQAISPCLSTALIVHSQLPTMKFSSLWRKLVCRHKPLHNIPCHYYLGICGSDVRSGYHGIMPSTHQYNNLGSLPRPWTHWTFRCREAHGRIFHRKRSQLWSQC